MKYTCWVLATLFTLGVSGLLAQEPAQKPMPEHGWMTSRGRLMEQLKLTDEQKKEIEKLRFDLQKELIAQRARTANAQLEYRELLKADNLDKAAIEKKAGELTELRSQGRSAMLNHWFAVNKLLTPDQQKVWRKVLERGSQMAMHRWRGRGMMRGQRGGAMRRGPGQFGPDRNFQRREGPGGSTEQKLEE